MHEPNLPSPHSAPAATTRAIVHRRFAAPFALLLPFLVVVGCDSDTTAPPEETVWLAEILPFPQEDPELQVDFDAAIEMTTGAGETRITLTVQGAPAGTVFGWAVRTGSCAGAGVPITLENESFDPVTANGFGEAQRLLVLEGNIPLNGSYAAEIYLDPSVGVIVLGCANMVELD